MSRKLLILIFLSTTIFLLTLRLNLSLFRYFDADEFAHLHWTYLLVHGYKPFVDFFLYHIPAFQLLLSPLFFLPENPEILIVARLLMFAFFIAELVLVFEIAKILTKSKLSAIISVCMLSAFPVLIDKSIEVRPDTAMTVCFLLAVWILIRKSLTMKTVSISGLFYGISTILFPKILFAAPALLVLLFIKTGMKPYRNLVYTIGSAIFFSNLPLGILICLALAIGVLPQAFESVIRAGFAVNAGKLSFPWWLTLSPYPFVYTNTGGISFPWFVSTVYWILTLIGLIIFWMKNKKVTIFFLTFFVFAFMFLVLFPAPYVQYFIPPASIAAILIGNLITVVLKKIPMFLHLPVAVLICLIVLSSYFFQYQERTLPNNDMKEQIQVIRDVLRISNPNETFYDMVGSYVFRPDGFPICCHPYGEFVMKLKYAPPTLQESLQKNQTKFLILDRTGSSLWKPFTWDLAFLKRNYLPAPVWKLYFVGVKFVCSNGTCHQIDMEGNAVPDVIENSFSLLVSETYKVIPNQPGSVSVDNQPVQNGVALLSNGLHQLTVSPDVTSLTIILDR